MSWFKIWNERTQTHPQTVLWPYKHIFSILGRRIASTSSLMCTAVGIWKQCWLKSGLYLITGWYLQWIKRRFNQDMTFMWMLSCNCVFSKHREWYIENAQLLAHCSDFNQTYVGGISFHEWNDTHFHYVCTSWFWDCIWTLWWVD